MILNETGFSTAFPTIKNYTTTLAVGRKPGGGTWGTAMCIRHRAAFQLLYRSSATDDYECVLGTLTLRGQAVTVLDTYWPPAYTPSLPDWRRILQLGKPPYVLLGDFNAHHKDLWGSRETDQRGRFLATLAAEFDLVVHGEGTTWFRPGAQDATLDLGWTSAGWRERVVRQVSDNSMNSDHFPWTLTVGAAVPAQPRRVPNWGKFKCLADDLLSTAGSEEGGVEQQAGEFTSLLQQANNRSLQTVNTAKPGAVWFWASDCEERRRDMRRAMRHWRRRRRVTDWDEYKRLQAVYRRAVLAAKRQSYESFTHKVSQQGSSWHAWRLLRGVQNAPDSPAILDHLVLAGFSREAATQKVWDFYHQMCSAVGGGLGRVGRGR
jgi:hypothetical protein